MPISKAQAAERLWINHKSVDYLVKKGRLTGIASSSSGREMITEESLFKEIGERYRRFGNAISLQYESEFCLCGCNEVTTLGKKFLPGHDQALEGIIRFFLFSGNSLDTREAIKLANRAHFNIDINSLITRGF
ncbi:hypothetical protein QCD85_08795 [Paenibacillus sp. PsM32]|uniref:hypothetical protein n=1 Tax=Paenibacillus sp. PsM32 TaxID=3030536 RepID=UPI00263AA038|nr:hypothetical protein [Paenibacillus sp. PsM32]MDN4618191.1 hypothetical protein [Paenibacillus sp. PsM32]